MESVIRKSVFSLALFFTLLPRLNAQLTTGDVLGTVTDPTSAVISGAQVTLTSADTAAVRSAKTDRDGNFLFSALQPGAYILRVESPGFSLYATPAFRVGAGDRVRYTPSLKVGNVANINVFDTASTVLHTDSANIQTTITTQQAADLPLSSRNFIQLAQLTPGANEATENSLGSGQRPDDRRQTSTLSANGQSDTLNQQLVDGLDNNEGSIGTIGVRPSVEAIEDLRVLTSSYPAETGKTAGAVINVITRGGTNQFHGSAYEFFHSDKTDARNFFARTGNRPKLHQNLFGASLGGPIFRDRTFFFADYEGYRQVSSVTYVNVVPTAYQQQHPGDFSDVGGPVIASPNAVALKFFALYPLPNANGATNGTYTYSPQGTQNSNLYDLRIDHHFSDRDQTFARYAHNQVDTFIPGTLPAVNGIEPGGSATFPGPSFQRAQQFVISHTHIASANTLFELKAGYTHLLNRTLPLTYGQNLGNQFGIVGSNYDQFSSMMPFLNITGYAGFGGADSLPLFNGTNTFQYMGSVTHTMGRHTLKAGASLIRRQIFNQQNAAANAAGSFSFNGQYSTTAYPTSPVSIRPLVDLLSGSPYTTRRVSQVYPRYPRVFEGAVYVQDDFRLSQKITLNAGLRWDLYTPLKEKFGHISMFNTDTNSIAVANGNSSDTLGVHTNYTSFAPRIGLSYNVRPTTVVHAAFGLSFFRDNNGPSVPFANAPYTFVYTPGPLTTSLSDPLPLPSAQSTTDLMGAARGVEPNFKNSYAEQFHFDIQQEIHNTVFTLGYVGMLARNLKIAPDINLAAAQIPADPTQPTVADFRKRRPFYSQYPNLNAGINIFRSQGMSNYNALQMALVHPYRNGLTATFNYTFAHSLSDTQAFSQSVLFASVDNSRFHQLEYSNSDLDQRHRITLLLNYALPFAQNTRGITRVFLHGWQVNALDVWGTGQPFTVTNSTARTNTGASSDRPNQSGNANLSNPSIQRAFDTSVFTPQTFGTIGTARRTSVYGPNYRHFDASLFKDFALRESTRLQLRAEGFNLTNTPNFGAPGATLGTPTFGIITATRLGSTPRQLQFAARITF
jgi:hypothetical protein